MNKLVSCLGILLAGALTAAPIQWSGNGHWYDVSTVSLSQSAARTAALVSTHLGMPGYLVTITSAEENAFVFSLTSQLAWTGGSDAAVEGEWRWLDGPEAGQLMTYTNWHSGEPNNSGNEDGLHLNRFAGFQTWNDAPDANSYLYIVEYSGDGADVPEPATAALCAAAGAILVLRRRMPR